MSWGNLFKKKILDRAYTYFRDDAVENMKVSKDKITANVCGTEYYEVEIHLCAGKVTDMYCSCPYAEDRNNCKHMAAVLFEWEADRELEDLELGRDLKRNTVPVGAVDEVERTIWQANENQMREFLSDVLHKDEKLFARFRTLIRPKITKTDMNKYKRQVDRIIDEYLGIEYFISYYKAYDFILEMETFLEEDVRMMMDSGCYLSAFELSSYMFVEVAGVEMDDSDGGLSMFADECVQIWHEILDYVDEETEEKIYKWFTSHLDGSIVDYMEEYIEGILMERFTSDKYLQDKLIYTAKKVEKAKKKKDNWSADYEVAKWASCHINVMEMLGKAQKDIFKYCKDNWKYSEIRKYYVSKCIENKNYDEAIKVLKESIELDAGMRGLVIGYSNKLKEIYKQTGNAEAYKQQLWKLVTKDNVASLEDFKELKGLYTEEEWKCIREQIFAALPKHISLAPLYKEDKLYDRLLEYVLSSHGIFALREYEKDLKERYPEEILQKYADELNKMAVFSADRKRYQEWVAILRRMLKIKGGKEKVHEITEQWRIIYKNRPAMMDELRKL